MKWAYIRLKTLSDRMSHRDIIFVKKENVKGGISVP